MSIRIIVGDCVEELRKLPDASVNCCVTSPPYWGLRDYGVAGQLGLESTPQEYVEKMVAVFAQVKRVLRDDGTLWLNLGDSYSAPNGRSSGGTYGRGPNSVMGHMHEAQEKGIVRDFKLAAKQLIGIPWRVAFALQADGWVLRQEIIWGKPNPMPESVRDRCTKSHEQIFLFAKATWSGAEPTQFANISDQDARWLALFLDTEGNICCKRSAQASGRQTYGAQVVFANTHRGLLEAAQAIVGTGNILERGGKNSPMFYYQISNQVARDLLHRIYPFFIVKQRQARLGIYLQDLLARKGTKRPGGYRSDEHSAELEKIWATMKSLNHFGKPDLSWVPEPLWGRWADCERYYYDADAIKEESITGDARKPYAPGQVDARGNGHDRNGGALRVRSPAGWKTGKGAHGSIHADGREQEVTYAEIDAGKRNKRSVWTVTTQPFKDAHFATFPPALIEPCILAGCPVGGVVLDPFGGAGTTGLVADRLQRSAILIELNPEYAAMAKERITADGPMFADVGA